MQTSSQSCFQSGEKHHSLSSVSTQSCRDFLSTLMHSEQNYGAFERNNVQTKLSVHASSDQAALFSQRPQMARGVLEHDIMLHSPGSCPSGVLTPAKILFWSASPAAAAQLPAESDASAPGLSEAVIWVHPAAISDAHAALLSACQGTSTSLSCR